MKKIATLLSVMCIALVAVAQPAKRKAEKAEAQAADAMTLRAQLFFPVQQAVDEQVVWRRDLYREIDLNKEPNSCLYYPVEVTATQVNLFTYIFKLLLSGHLKAYEYRLDGNEVFTEEAQLKLKQFLDNYHIYYERRDKGVFIDNSDIPSREVTAYYMKECVYYDQNTSSFHRKVLALCPILKRSDDFGDALTSYPLFWVKYDDLAPFLARQTVMPSERNNAACISMDDFFVNGLYQGKIYKTANHLGKTLAQYCPTETALTQEQQRIEKEIATFEEQLWGDKQRKAAADSLAQQTAKEQSVSVKNNRRTRGKQVKTSSSSSKQSTQPKSKATKSKSSSGRTSARMTVRRERH